MANEDDDDENKADFNLLKGRKFSISPASTNSSNASGVEIWPLQLNTTFVDHYVFGEVVGIGSYAEVRECVDTRNLERCAVKIVNMTHLKRQAPSALFNQHQEIKLFKRLRHPNIITLKECLVRGPKVYIFLEYCTFVLSDLLAKSKDNKLAVSVSRDLFHQLMLGIEYLNNNKIIHRDIKPQNLLITNCGVLKIIDLGVAQVVSIWSKSDICSNYEGSPLFQAPEVVSGQTEYVGTGVDVWSAGVTLYLMLYGRYPFFDETLLGLYDKILGDELAFPKDCTHPNQAIQHDLLASMLEKSFEQRASLHSVLSHPWLKLRNTMDYVNLCDLTHKQSLTATQDQKDVYRSMSVLPYLYSLHHPNLSITKPKTNISPSISPVPSSSLQAFSPIAAPKEATSTQTMLGLPSDLDEQAVSNDPNRMISDQPIEWGTQEQYNLMKVPIIRANRLRK